jgi:TusA-related sulfurtransferase
VTDTPFQVEENMEITRELDARGFNCPVPLMKTKKALGEMQSGQVLRVLATDGGSMRDILAFARQAGHEMISQEHVGKDYIHILRCR